jgi:hypothetical protein
MRDGVLESGVVTEAREPRDLVYLELSRLFQLRNHDVEKPDTQPEVIPLRWTPWLRNNTFSAVDLQSIVSSSNGDRAWGSLKSHMARYWEQIARNQWKNTGEDLLLWSNNKLDIAGVPFQMPVINDRVRPIVVTPENPEAVIPVNRRCDRLHILGQVTFAGGFPSTVQDGGQAGSYVLEFSDGRKKEISLRHGHELAQANLIQDAGRLDPQTTDSQRALLFVKDTAREHYQVLLYSIPVQGATLARIRCKLEGQQPPLAVFAITTETSTKGR